MSLFPDFLCLPNHLLPIHIRTFPPTPCYTVTLSPPRSIYTCIFYYKYHPHALTLTPSLSPPPFLHPPPPLTFRLRPVQPGSIGGWHVWPKAAWPAASWSHPDPEAAWGGGRLRRLQHRTQCPQLLPERMFTHKHVDVQWTHTCQCTCREYTRWMTMCSIKMDACIRHSCFPTIIKS